MSPVFFDPKASIMSGIDFDLKASMIKEQEAFLKSGKSKKDMLNEAPFADGAPEFHFEDEDRPHKDTLFLPPFADGDLMDKSLKKRDTIMRLMKDLEGKNSTAVSPRGEADDRFLPLSRFPSELETDPVKALKEAEIKY